MNDHTEMTPEATEFVSTSERKERLLTVGYSTAAVIGSIGWSISLGWAAISFLNWLFS
jgi:hypothetical protein